MRDGSALLSRTDAGKLMGIKAVMIRFPFTASLTLLDSSRNGTE
jgi:hypothetical protein